MTRGELVAALAVALDAYDVPVVADPLQAAQVPCVVAQPGSPFRARTTACWTQAVELVGIAGRMDDVGSYDVADQLADTLLEVLAGVANVHVDGIASAPGTTAIGTVDYLAFTVNVTLYGTGPTLPRT